MASPERRLSPLMRDGSKPAVKATDLRRLSNLAHVNGIRPLLKGTGKTKTRQGGWHKLEGML